MRGPSCKNLLAAVSGSASCDSEPRSSDNWYLLYGLDSEFTTPPFPLEHVLVSVCTVYFWRDSPRIGNGWHRVLSTSLTLDVRREIVPIKFRKEPKRYNSRDCCNQSAMTARKAQEHQILARTGRSCSSSAAKQDIRVVTLSVELLRR